MAAKTAREGIKSYYKSKVEQLEQVVSERQQVGSATFGFGPGGLG